MEAMTVVTASLIDRGLEDYMMETAMLKVFTTERLWEAVNDAFQIHGGSAYFNDHRSNGCSATRASIRSAKAATKC